MAKTYQFKDDQVENVDNLDTEVEVQKPPPKESNPYKETGEAGGEVDIQKMTSANRPVMLRTGTAMANPGGKDSAEHDLLLLGKARSENKTQGVDSAYNNPSPLESLPYQNSLQQPLQVRANSADSS